MVRLLPIARFEEGNLGGSPIILSEPEYCQDAFEIIEVVLGLPEGNPVTWSAGSQITHFIVNSRFLYADENAKLIPVDTSRDLRSWGLHVEFTAHEISCDHEPIFADQELQLRLAKVRSMILADVGRANRRLDGKAVEILQQIELALQ